MAKIYSNLYAYDASYAAAVAFFALFFLISLIHLYQLLRTRTWYFTAFFLGGVLETIGYAARAVSIHQKPNYTLGPYAISSVLVLVAPSLLSASIYMELGRIILLTDGEKFTIIRRTWLTKIFVIGDVISFFVQAAGASILTQQTASSVANGEKVIKIGLVVQILFFGLFIITSVLFNMRLRRNPTSKSVNALIPWQKHINTLYVGSLIILARCIYRLVEYIEGTTGYLQEHEWCAYVFDATLMLLVMILFSWIHPSEVKALLNGHGKYIAKVFKTKVVHTTEASTRLVGGIQRGGTYKRDGYNV